MYVCMCIYVSMYVWIYVYKYVFVYVCMYVCIEQRSRNDSEERAGRLQVVEWEAVTQTLKGEFVCTYVCMYVSMYVCMYLCMNIIVYKCM